MKSDLECPICFSQYDAELRRPCIGICGHSICEECKIQLISAKCPQCMREDAFAIKTINYQVLGILRSQEQGKGQKTVESIGEGVCSECKNKARKLRLCIDCGIQSQILVKTGNGNDMINWNTAELDVNDCLRRANTSAVCGDCALDGAHSSHKVINLSFLQKKIDDATLNDIKNRRNSVENNIKERMETLNSNFGIISQYITEYIDERSSVAEDRYKEHYGNIERYIEQKNDFSSEIQDLIIRTTISIDELKHEIEFVKKNKEPYSMKSVLFASSKPIITADRKQISKDNLLIGTFDPSKNAWSLVGCMPNQKSNYAIASFQNKVLIIGGMKNGVWLKSVECYDRVSNSRKDAPKLNHERTRTAAGFHDDEIFVCGGYNGTYMTSVESCTSSLSKWVVRGNLQKARADCAVVSCNGDLYVLGGYNGKDYEESIERYNKTTKKFEVVGDMNGSRAGFGACVYKGRIYVAGGWSSSNNTLRTVRSYDPMTNKWREELPLTKERKYLMLHATNETIYAVRGCAEDWGLIPDIERLNVNNYKWEIIPCETNTPTQQNTVTSSSSLEQTTASTSGSTNEIIGNFSRVD